MAENNKALTIADNKKQIVNIVQNDNFKKQLAAALMNRLPEDYVVRSAIATINGSSIIQECAPLTIAASILLLAQAGLAPEPWKGHGYLVPRNIKVSKRGEPDRWEKHCTALIGYRGYINIAYKSPQVKKVGANPVYEGDVFDLDQVDGTLVHKPWIRPEEGRRERGKLIGAYAFVKMANGEILTEWMLKEDIDAVRARSTASDSGPWKTDYAEMARKTPLRRLFKWIPDPDLQRIAALEEANDYGNVAVTIDGDTGEIVTRIIETVEPEKPTIHMPQRKEAAKVIDAEPQTENIPDGEYEDEPNDSPIAGIFEEKTAEEVISEKKTPIPENKPSSNKVQGIGAGQAKRIHAIASSRKTRNDADFTELKQAFKIEHLADFPKDRLPLLEKWAEGGDLA